MSLLYFKYRGLDTDILQGIYIIGLFINTYAMPYIISKTRKKMERIQDVTINKSYSSISIEILDMIILTALLTISLAFMMIIITVLVQINCNESQHPNLEECLNVPIVKITYTISTCQSETLNAASNILVLKQISEWCVMLYMIIY